MPMFLKLIQPLLNNLVIQWDCLRLKSQLSSRNKTKAVAKFDARYHYYISTKKSNPDMFSSAAKNLKIKSVEMFSFFGGDVMQVSLCSVNTEFGKQTSKFFFYSTALFHNLLSKSLFLGGEILKSKSKAKALMKYVQNNFKVDSSEQCCQK